MDDLFAAELRRREDRTLVHDRDLFTVYLDADGEAVVEMEGRRYGAAVPPASRSPARMPAQHTGTCYFHAAMNALINQTQFAHAFLAHTRSQIASSRYDRQGDESDGDAARRRGGLDLTVRRHDPASTLRMRKVFAATSADPELYKWARNVIMYHVIQTALDSLEDGFEKGSRAGDSVAYLLLRNWTSGALSGKDRYEAALEDVDGGWPEVALHSVLSMSGLDVAAEEDGDAFVARIPSSGWTMCVSAHKWTDGAPSRVPDDGSHTGVYVQMYGDDEGHATAYTRGAGGTVIVDSHGSVSSVIEHVARDAVGNAVGFNNYRFAAVYTLQTHEWPLHQRPDVPDVPEVPEVSDVREVSASAWESGTGDPELMSALGVMSEFVNQPLTQTAGGTAPGVAWAALAALVTGMSFLGSLQ